MRLFVSGKIGAELGPSELMRELEQRGHSITFDWTSIPHLRPYELHSAESRAAAILEIQGVKDADALVIVSHERGVGMFVELGVALALEKPVYALASPPARTMFFFHPLVRIVESKSDLFELLGPP